MYELNTKSGEPLSPIGIGTWTIASRINQADLGSQYRGVEPAYGNEDREIEALRYSISLGQNHIDTAELYGGFYTDEVIGRAIAGLPREKLYIADKLWRTSLDPAKVRPTVQAMLQKLGTDYLDMLYIHWPADEPSWQGAIPEIDKLIDEGVVRHLGVSNFTIEQLEEVLRIAKHPPLAVQMNFNVLYKDEVDQGYLDFCAAHHITVVAYQPIKRQEVLDDPVIREVAQAHGATPAQVALAWLIHKGALTIPKALDMGHIEENVGAVELQLSEADMAKLAAAA